MIWLHHSLASSVTPRLLAPPAPSHWSPRWSSSGSEHTPGMEPSRVLFPQLWMLSPQYSHGSVPHCTQVSGGVPLLHLHTTLPSMCFSLEYFWSSVQSLSHVWPHEPQHARPPCPSPTPGVYPNSCSLSRWCHPTISSSVVPSSSCPQSFPASGSFQMSQLFTLGGQSIGASASTSVPPMNTQDWSPLGWT